MGAPGERWDAIVVGSGLGGLTCAGYLAAGGLRVLVLEQYAVAGGNSHVFRRRRAYEFDVGVHYVGDCGADGIVPAILGGLGAGDRVAFRQLDPDCFDRIVLPDLTLRMPASWTGYLDRLTGALPGDAAGLASFVDVCRTVGDEQRTMLLAPAGTPVADLLAASPVSQEWGRRTLNELFDHCGLSTLARTVLAAQSPNYGAGPAEATVATHAIVTDHYIRGAYFPEGGGQMLAATLVEVLAAHGGLLLTGAKVARILVRDRQVAGVRLADGTEFEAPLVVSNADYRRTVLDLVGPEHFSRWTVNSARDARMALPFAALYLGLSRELPVENEANIWWYDGDDIDGYYRELGAGRQPDEVRSLFISFASRKDPGSRRACPPGHANVQLMTLCPAGYAPWGVAGGPAEGHPYRRDPAYLAEKERFTEAMLRAAERVLGPFRADITHVELATPLTQERYTLSTGGTPFGVARWGRLGTRPDTTTSVPGLHLVGQSTRFGTGVTGVMVGGLACAGRILGRSLISEVYAGAVLGDPAALPDRPAGWDPLVASRGRPARRDSPGRV